MGSQQILLLVLGAIIIAVSTAGAIGLFKQNLVSENRKAILSDLQQMAAHANAYYKAPLNVGGGGRLWVPKVNGVYQGNRCGLWLNYAGYEEHNSGDTFITDNGTFLMWINSYTDDVLKIEGTGTEIGRDGENPVKARMKLTGATGQIEFTVLN
ncbi:MAG: hypothetical protein K9N40_04410 [Candidatus Cloacimonetes bacterium]|nr:hypothetical protein [Candidatus Cloacimonadota bacterium]